MKLLLISVGILLAAGCATKKISGNGAGQTIEMKAAKKSMATIGKTPLDNHPVNITAAAIKGNTLTIEVSYSGGCQEHHFDLVGNEAIAKSMPPQRTVRLVHTGEPDACEALIRQTLSFDISNLAYKQEAGSEIILRLEGWDTDLRYIYK